MIDRPLQEGAVAAVVVEAADEAGVDLEVVEAEVVEQADLAEVAAEVLDAELAAGALECADDVAEGVEMMQHAGLGDFQPQARRRLGLLVQARRAVGGGTVRPAIELADRLIARPGMAGSAAS